MSHCQTFSSATLYVQSITSLEGQLDKVGQIIDALYNLAITAAGNEDIESYSLNDGQVVIQTRLKGVDEIGNSIRKWEQVRHMLLNRLNGRGFVLRDAGTLNSHNHGHGGHF